MRASYTNKINYKQGTPVNNQGRETQETKKQNYKNNIKIKDTTKTHKTEEQCTPRTHQKLQPHQTVLTSGTDASMTT